MTRRSTRRKLLAQSAQLAGAIGIGIPILGAGRLTEDSLARGKQGVTLTEDLAKLRFLRR